MPAILLGVAAILSPHVLLALGLAFAAGGMRFVAPDRSRLERGALAVGLAGLGTATWLTATIIGPLPATYSALGDGPIGDPAARLLILLLAAPVTVYLFDWRLIPVAVALLGRVGAELLPAGVALWQGIAMPAALVLAFVGVHRRRPQLVAIAVGAYGLWSGTPFGRIGGAMLLGAQVLANGGPPVRARAEAGHVARLLGAAGMVIGLAGAFRVQIVYTVVLAIVLLAALARRWMR